jgi:septal ring factor EnvC (AmiA/AmiB activator)
MLAAPDTLSVEMNRTIKYLCLFAALGAALCGGAHRCCAQTADAAREKAKLEAVRGQIAALTSRLGGQLKQRDVLSARLREADLGITAKRQRLDALRSEFSAGQRRRDELRATEARNRGALDAERAALAGQVRSAYLMGPQEHLKLLLDQTDPAGAGRMLAYYGYLTRERALKIDGIREHAVRIQALVVELEQTSAELQALQTDTAREMSGLQLARQARTEALAAVTKQVSSGSEELEILKRQEQAEETLVAELARVLQDFPVDKQESFDTLRGKLPWPVQGRMTARYQDSRANGPQPAVRWNGVLIESSRGAKVRAPYFGRVVYADWLQGLGLLLIIGHSGNYMTLYGHAEVLYKSVGDWVAPGDVIAALPDTGGAVPQLYFEIRDGRKTVDPKSWLKAAP